MGSEEIFVLPQALGKVWVSFEELIYIKYNCWYIGLDFVSAKCCNLRDHLGKLNAVG